MIGEKVHPIYAKAMEQKRGQRKAWEGAAEGSIWLKTKDIAAIVRSQLKKRYPTIRFQVVSDGHTVRVRWQDANITSKELDALLANYESRFFCGNCDYSFSGSSWLMPDGTMTLAERGMCCCGRPYAEYPEPFTSDPPQPQALLINSNIWIFAHRQEASNV